jgi:choline dehydrogenase-like flavoprotein
VTEFDYLVIGGGTAGCIVAARLAEDPAVSVGLVEWGPSDEHEPRARAIRRWADLRVRGVPGLRVVDASVFPTIPSVNPVVTVMLTAERAAGLIRRR